MVLPGKLQFIPSADFMTKCGGINKSFVIYTAYMMSVPLSRHQLHIYMYIMLEQWSLNQYL